MDGLTSEFHKAFWEQTSHLILDSLNEAHKKGELTISQNREIIRLIPKPKKKEELKKLDNWRPISLLNVDYKLDSKALANRMEKVLPRIIHSDQTGYIKGRFIGECIRTIDNVIYLTDHEKRSGIALFLDFKKTYDSLDHDFILKTLETFNFGESMIQWFSTLYSNANSCIINNGHTSEYFPIKRGVRQGDPLSGSLFVLAVELLANALRKNKYIKAITVNDKIILLSQHADDTTIFIEDIQSAKVVLQLIETFGEVSSLILNKRNAKDRGLADKNNAKHGCSTFYGPKNR